MPVIDNKPPSASVGNDPTILKSFSTGKTTGNNTFAQKLTYSATAVASTMTGAAANVAGMLGNSAGAQAINQVTAQLQKAGASALQGGGSQHGAVISGMNTQYASNTITPQSTQSVGAQMTPSQQQMMKMASMMGGGDSGASNMQGGGNGSQGGSAFNGGFNGSAGFSGGNMTGVSSSVTGGGMALGAGVNALPGSGGGGMGMGQTNSSQGISGGTDPTAGNAINATGGSTGALMDQTKQMQEMQMSFNLQYLNLQNSMQNESRQFTMVSNIMKTKHDTVKNTISNVR